MPIARLALNAALMMPDVFDGEAGPNRLRVTTDGPAGLLRGVSVVAEPDGRYGVDLCLVAGLVPLVPLGEEIKRRIRERARRDGLADQLGSITVEFARLVTPEEFQREAVDTSELATPVPPAAPPTTPAEESHS